MSHDFDTLVKEAEADPNILGLILQGSRGKGFETDDSDYDVQIVVKDGTEEMYKKKYQKNVENADAWTHSLSQLKTCNAWNGPEHWDRYDYLHVKILVDKTDGLIQKLCGEKGHIPPEEKDAYVRGRLDAYLDSFFRSVKAYKKGNKSGSLLRAAGSVPFLLDVVFGLNGRHTPFLDYLEQELQTYPLEKLPWNPADFYNNVIGIVSTGSITAQQEVAKALETWARKEGYGDVFDAWEGKDRWAMEYKS